MANIKSVADLEKELNKLILKAMKQIGKEAETDLKQSVQENVYDTYSPHYYKRTGDLKRSVTHDVYQAGNFTSAKIYHDLDRMRQIAPTREYRIGTHYSTVKSYFPQEYAYFIPATINDGTSGKIFGEGAWTKPRRYFSKVENIWKTGFKGKLKSKLESYGLKLKRG